MTLETNEDGTTECKCIGTLSQIGSHCKCADGQFRNVTDDCATCDTGCAT